MGSIGSAPQPAAPTGVSAAGVPAAPQPEAVLPPEAPPADVPVVLPLSGGTEAPASGGVLPLPAPAPAPAPERALEPAADVVMTRSVVMTGVALPTTGVDVDALVRLGLLLLAVGVTVLLLLTGPAAQRGRHPAR